MKKNHEILFTPMKVGGVTIQNRFVHAPMEGTSPIEGLLDYKFNENSHQYLIERAKNGVGLIIPGITCVKNLLGNKWLHENEELFLGPVKDLIKDIHSYGSKFFLQLGAGFGRVLVVPNEIREMMFKAPHESNPFFAAASEGMPNVWDPKISNREMTVKEIQDIVDGFAKSALLCKRAGIDGVEIHAIHEGYLLDQFTIANTNQRKDEYGGSLENRCRFVTDIIKAIKKECGEDYPVIVRYSVTSKMRGFNKGAVPGEVYDEFGRDYEESIACAKILEEAGADALDADNGSYDSWFWAHPPVYMPLACNLKDAAFIKKHVKIPVFCAGRMENPDTSAKAIKDGLIDGVAIGRQFLADGEYCKKVKEGKTDDIRPCIACHNGCFAISQLKTGGTGMNLAGNGHCAINPYTLEEKKRVLNPISSPKNIAVIGGGIGGMEAARVLTLRGHHVTLYEKSNELGGVFIAAAAADFKEKDKMLIQWYIKQMKDLKINIQMNKEITEEALKNIDADEFIIAIGATPRRLKFPGNVETMEAIEYLRGYKEVGENVIIIGGGLTGCEIAYDLALKNKKPIIVEKQDDILNVPNLCAANSNMLRELVRYYKIPVYTNAEVKETKEQEATIVQNGKEIKVNADSIITSIGYNVRSLPQKEHVHVIGDAYKVGNLMNVVWQAYDLANNL